MQTRRLCFVADAYRSLGCKSFGNGTVPGNLGVGVGSGPITIIDFGFVGGPCPVPSCATANVVAVDAITKKVTIAHFIVALLRVDRGGGEVSTQSATSPDDASIKNAPHQETVPGGRRISFDS